MTQILGKGSKAGNSEHIQNRWHIAIKSFGEVGKDYQVKLH
jgi:hypothetical protein